MPSSRPRWLLVLGLWLACLLPGAAQAINPPSPGPSDPSQPKPPPTSPRPSHSHLPIAPQQAGPAARHLPITAPRLGYGCLDGLGSGPPLPASAPQGPPLKGGRLVVMVEPVSEEKLRDVARFGFDGIRYAMDWADFEPPNAPGSFKPGIWAHLDEIFTWARRYHVGALLDLHGSIPGWLDGFFFYDPNAICRWQHFWSAILGRYRGVEQSVLLGYELFNEPNGIPPERWWQEANHLITQIRRVDWRPIVVGPVHFNNPDYLWGLQPFPQRNIVYTIHTYRPYPFTMQGVPAPYHQCNAVVNSYPGRYDECAGADQAGRWDRNRLLAEYRRFTTDFQAAYRQQFGRDPDLFVGEWDYGPDSRAPFADAMRLVADSVSVFSELGWSWAWHHWGGPEFVGAYPPLLCWSEHGQKRFDLAKLRALGSGV